MVRGLGAVGAVLLVSSLLTGCRGDAEPAADESSCPSPSPTVREVPDPAHPDPCESEPPDFDDDPTESGATPVSGSASPSGTATPGAADVDCLVHGGTPWHVSKPDLESQIEGLMQGIQVDDVHIDGDQTLTVTPGLQATFTDDSTTTITATLPSLRKQMVVTQVHSGSASGGWKVDGSALLPAGAWTGGIHGTTRITIDGRAGQAPFGMPDDSLADVKLIFSCADGSLDLTVPGKSPFLYLFR